MDTYHDSHIQEEILEKYALHQLAEEQTEPVEIHLLICSTCQNRLDEIDQYIRTMKSALHEVNKDQAEERSRKHRWLSSKPGLALLVASALLLVGGFLLISPRHTQVSGTDIQLVASRGGDSIPIAHARAGSSLILHMDATEIAKADSYTVELVNATGSQVWRGPVRSQANRLEVEVSSELKPGKYWARLFDSSQPPVLLREYGLELR